MMRNREIEKVICTALDIAQDRGWIKDETDIKNLSVSIKRTGSKTSYDIKLSPVHDVKDFKMEFDLE